MDSNTEDQNNELLALSEICGQGEFHVFSKDELQRSAFISKLLQSDYANNAGYVEIKPDLGESSICVRAMNHEVVVRYLPPIMVEFILPFDYPSHQPPKFNITASWMTPKQIDLVGEKLIELWKENEGAVVLYSWYDFLKESLIPFLGISEVLDVSEVVKSLETSSKVTLPNKPENLHDISKHCDNLPDLRLPTSSSIGIQELDQKKPRKCHVNSEHSGVVAKWNASRGFGFISSNESQYFFHIKNCDKDLEIFRGLNVNFQIVKSVKKPESFEAINIVEQIKLASPKEKSNPDCAKTTMEPTNFENLVIHDVVESVAQVNVENEKPTELDVKKIETYPPLLKALSEYSQEEEQRNFEQSFHLCYVCFSKKQGVQSMAFPGCSHVFCKDCMKDYFKVQIEDGQFSNLTCPEDKCSSQALPNQVKSLVSDQLFELYERQLLATTLESMTDILPCPRPGCQCPTLIDREASMGRCPSCMHTFCIYCKAAFHGIDPCKIRSELIDEYMNCDPTRKAFLEKIYGKKQLTTLVNTCLSEKYISTETKPCPKCRAPIEKYAGCNKMTCNKCQTYFCYLCGERLPERDPYEHFKDLSKGCFDKLFEGVNPDDDDDDDDENVDDDVNDDDEYFPIV